jgi:hypothetical protein
MTTSSTLRAHLVEGLAALDAFERYCRDYEDHGLSPRLELWREAVKTALSPADRKRAGARVSP